MLKRMELSHTHYPPTKEAVTVAAALRNWLKYNDKLGQYVVSRAEAEITVARSDVATVDSIKKSGKEVSPISTNPENFCNDTLKPLRFEAANEEEIARLLFKGGQAQTVEGDGATNLRDRLSGVEQDTPTLSQSSRNEREQVKGGPAPAPRMSKIDFRPSTTSSLGSKGWFYNQDENGRGFILAFVNAKGSCSVRPFDADQNIAFRKTYGSGYYQQHFAEEVIGATPLTVDAQPNLERDCKHKLPDRLFEYLRKQIDRIERSGTKNK